MQTENWNKIFEKAIEDYHRIDSVDTVCQNPYNVGSLELLLYRKNWIDTVQWHLEDIIREPNINAEDALEIKRRIDKSNQYRTELVEFIDDWFLEKYKNIKIKKDAKLNTESPAWAIDRLSILELKIYHMQIEAQRKDADELHRQKCVQKLDVLLEQRKDLSKSIEDLLENIENGNIEMKVYRQMKMYNDPSLNPVLYNQKSK